MMQGIVSRGRGLPGGVDGEVVHSAITLSSARSLPVRGQRGGAWTAWEELASLADADADDARMAASQLPPARGPGRNPAAGLARTLYGDLESSRSENARAFCAPQPRSAWAEAPGRSSASALPPQPSARHAPAEALEDASTGGPGAAWAGLRASPLTTRSAHSVPRSASPAHRAPSPQLRASVQTNEIAMAQGTEDFLSASQGFLREYNRLARLGLAQGNLRIAEENLTQALELVQQGQMSSTPVAAVTYNLLGCMCRRMGRLNEAVDYLHRSLDVLAARRNGAEPVVERDIDLADVHMNMSSAQSALNRHDAALLHVETAIALLSDRLGMGERPDLQGVASEQDSKDVRMLVIAHYNRGAEMRTLNQHTGSLQAFDTAMQLADSFLPPGDSLLSMIKKAQRRARGGQTAAALPDRMGAPPGVTPLRLSMLQQESSHSVLQLASSAADQGAPERRKHEASTLETASHRSMSSMASRRSPRSGRSQLTPQGWHNLHAVHCGNFASSARRSARDGGGGAGVEASRQPRVNFTDTHVQTGLVPVSQQAEMRATLPRNVFQRKHAAWRGTDGDTAEVELDENDEVLGLAQEHDIFALIRAAPDASVVKVASRYVPQSDKTRGLLDYGHSLTRSLIKTKEMCESGTQVEQEYMDAERGAGGGGEGGHFVRLKSLPGGWRRENVELTVEDMVSQRAREELRGRGSERASSALRAGSVDTSEAGRRQGASLDRTYRSHLQRTREAHLRFNRVALTLQKAYRCHLARGVATELLRNPRHLKAMLAKQIHAFASLLQSNIRCMLAKRHVAKRASLRIMSAEDRWRARRNRAAYVIQAWFWGVIGSRLVAKRHSGPPAAAACVQRAYRSHLARRIKEDKNADKVHKILWECQQVEDASTAVIQRSYRCCLARRCFKAAEMACRELRRQPGVHCLWPSAATTLGAPALRIALKQQEWAVVSLQQRVLSCLEHQGWLEQAHDVVCQVREAEATRIQCAWRYREARRWAIAAIRQHDLERNRRQVEEAAIIIQHAVLGSWARRRLVKLHRTALGQVLGSAAADIQRVWCGHAARNWVRNKIRLLELQRVNQERHHELAMRLQLGMRCCWARRELTDRYWESKSQQACISIQCAARIWFARNEFQVHVYEEMQRRKMSAVLAIQAFAFSNAVTRRRPLARFWRERREASATILAAVYKAHLVRLDMQDLRLENQQAEYAITLQRVFRAHRSRVTARQRIRVVWRETQEKAALRLQTAMRAKWARNTMHRVGMLHMETHRLRQEAEMVRRLQACRMLQARLRSYLACEYVLRPEKANRMAACARLLCRVYRGHIGRRLFQRRRYEREVEAARTLQDAYRLHLARVLLRRAVEHTRIASLLTLAERQQASAAMIQHAYFMHVSRLIVKDRASQVINCMARRAVARTHYTHTLAASALQAAVRRGRCRHQLQVALAIDTLVACVRRAYMRNKCRRKLAVDTLVASARGALMRNRCRHKLASRNITAAALAALIRQSYASKLAADTISAAAAAYLVRRRYREREWAGERLRYAAKSWFARFQFRKECASVRIQSVVRGHMDREWTRAYEIEMREHRHMLACIVKIQAVQRGHAARQAVGSIKDAIELAAACVEVQSRLRRAQANVAYGKWLMQLHHIKWAIVLQRYWRGALARHLRKQLAILKVHTEAALQVQRVVRGHHGRLRTIEHIAALERIRRAVVMQAWFRGILGRVRASLIRQHNLQVEAATMIQAGARGMAGRAVAREMRHLRFMEQSAIKIQARARGIMGRERAQARRMEELMRQEMRQQMALSIQCAYRQHMAKIAHIEAIEQRATLDFFREYCSDILQCTVRCFNARNRLRKRREAAVLITALGRGWQARRKAQKRRQVLARQSLYVAPHLLRPEHYVVPPGLDLRRPRPKSKVRKFRAEARPEELLKRQPSPISWHLRQKQAVLDFQSKPQIKAFFSDLQARGHGKGTPGKSRLPFNPPSKPPSKPAPKPVTSSPEKPARPASAMQQRPAPAPAAAVRPASAVPSMAGRLQAPTASKDRVPPRFQKLRQGKAAGAGDSEAESAGSVKKAKPRNQRPRARGSDSERNSDDELPGRPAQSIPAMQVPVAAHAPVPAFMPTQPRPAVYNKDDISSDPPSDEQKRKKSKDKEKRRDKDKADRSASPTKSAPPKPKPAEEDAKVEAAFNHCRLGKYREVETALAEGLPVNSRFGPDNNTMLIQCAINGQKRIAKLLLRNFAEMNAQNNKGDTAMHCCYKFNYKELGEYMKSKGADDTIRNAKGQTCYEAKK